jgi:hypothetical protein
MRALVKTQDSCERCALRARLCIHNTGADGKRRGRRIGTGSGSGRLLAAGMSVAKNWIATGLGAIPGAPYETAIAN